MAAPIVRYPAVIWARELDEHERAFEEEAETPVGPEFIRLDAHLSADAVRERLAHLDRLAAGGAFLPPPAVNPILVNWLVMLLWPIAALCAVGFVVAVVG